MHLLYYFRVNHIGIYEKLKFRINFSPLLKKKFKKVFSDVLVRFEYGFKKDSSTV